MGLRLHCDEDDADIARGERYLELRLIGENRMPIIAKTYCVEHATAQGRDIVTRYFNGAWAGLEAQWREG